MAVTPITNENNFKHKLQYIMTHQNLNLKKRIYQYPVVIRNFIQMVYERRHSYEYVTA